MPLLIAAGVSLPGLHEGDPADVNAQSRSRRIALEAYPGLLAREVLGNRSYKSDDRAKQTPARLERRGHLLDALERGQTSLNVRLELNPTQLEELRVDASGDSLDAVLCLVQAAWGSRHGSPWFGLPETLDPLEGWIVSA